jgi:hypothetical protein
VFVEERHGYGDGPGGDGCNGDGNQNAARHFDL